MDAALPQYRDSALNRVHSRDAVSVEIAWGPPNTRLKLTARVDQGMHPSSARRSLSAIR